MYKKYFCNALLLYTIKCRFLLIMIIVWKVLASPLTYFIWTIFDAFDRLNLDTILNFLSCWKKQAVKGYPRHVKRYICNEKQNVNDLNHISIIKLDLVGGYRLICWTQKCKRLRATCLKLQQIICCPNPSQQIF